jgi:hypothetical protein
MNSAEGSPRSRPNDHRIVVVYFEQAAQYPPISNRDTTILKRQSFSTCAFSFSKTSLTNSMILPHRRQAMWM